MASESNSTQPSPANPTIPAHPGHMFDRQSIRQSVGRILNPTKYLLQCCSSDMYELKLLFRRLREDELIHRQITESLRDGCMAKIKAFQDRASDIQSRIVWLTGFEKPFIGLKEAWVLRKRVRSFVKEFEDFVEEMKNSEMLPLLKFIPPTPPPVQEPIFPQLPSMMNMNRVVYVKQLEVPAVKATKKSHATYVQASSNMTSSKSNDTKMLEVPRATKKNGEEDDWLLYIKKLDIE